MRKLLRKLFLRPVLWAANKYSSRPDRQRIFIALTKLLEEILQNPGKRGLVIPFEQHSGKFIIFSDQHKGRRNGADDFAQAEPNYLAALDYYSSNNFCFINLGDCEELWENNLWQIIEKNKAVFEAEKKFLVNSNYVKIFGNHDLFWDNDPFAGLQLKNIFGENLKVYEGVVLQTNVNRPPATVNTIKDDESKSNPENKDSVLTIDQSPLPAGVLPMAPLTIFMTHGHQGDAQSDGNWLTKLFVSRIWGPLQSLLHINPNTPAYNAEKKTLHNSIMYDWSSEQKNMLLVTGHTHQPVFKSLTQLEKLYKQFQFAGKEKNNHELDGLLNQIKKVEKEFTAVSLDYMSMKPSYFNSGCCCYSDGDITGIEIADGNIRLIKWKLKEGKPERQLMEEIELEKLQMELTGVFPAKVENKAT